MFKKPEGSHGRKKEKKRKEKKKKTDASCTRKIPCGETLPHTHCTMRTVIAFTKKQSLSFENNN